MEELELDVVGNRTPEEMDALLQSKHTLSFVAEDMSLWYEISYANNRGSNFCYQVKIGTEVGVVYEERYVHLVKLMQDEPFDLSKFKIARL